jgi:aryl-alcohol dehydrogenase-like predicted oxidoreductase
MQYGHIPGIDKPISRLVQGTPWFNTHNAKSSFALLDAVFEQGCRAVDTAHGYGGGECERVVGRWVRERGVRDELVIIGKGAHPYGGRNRVTPEDIASDLHESLDRFGFDHIDLYLLHRDDPSVPVGPIVEALNEHHRAGLIGIFGGSNWSAARVREANEYAAAHGLVPFAASSPNFSLAVQVKPPWEGCLSISGPAGAADRAWYRAQHMPLFTWSSLAGGFFAGRYRRDNLATLDGPGDRLCIETYCVEENFQRLDRAERLAAEHGVTPPQIALAYVMSQPLDIYALVGCQNGAEFAANAAALDIRLTPEELAWLDGERG